METKNLLNFLLEVGKLKKMPRTGFVWLGIKDPETIGEHIFRVAMLNWILSYQDKNLNQLKVIKAALSHDLCEVYAGDMTPYWGLLPEDEEERKEMLKHWVRLPKEEKLKRDKVKFEKEKESLEKLLSILPDKEKQKDIFVAWLDYERKVSKEGKFVAQGDKIEALLQALEYWGTQEDSPVIGWWEEIYETVDIPILKDFTEEIREHFYEKKNSPLVKFFLNIGKLKKFYRRGWVLRGVKNPETIAENTFMTAILVWVLLEKELNLEKALKMSLVKEICEIYAKDRTPYEKFLEKGSIDFENWPRFLLEEKENLFKEDCEKERKSLVFLTKDLPSEISSEIISLWEDFKFRKSFEGRRVNQIHHLANYLQAAQYYAQDKSFPIKAWTEQMHEVLEDEDLVSLKNEIEERFIL